MSLAQAQKYGSMVRTPCCQCWVGESSVGSSLPPKPETPRTCPQSYRRDAFPGMRKSGKRRIIRKMENVSITTVATGGTNDSWPWQDSATATDRNLTWNETEILWNQTHHFPQFCDAWEAAQHNLFQTANFFFAASFLIPRNLKQNILLARTLLGIGFVLLAVWGGFNVCGLDIMIWNLVLGCVNIGHAISLTARLLPPRLSLDLTDLYLKLFKPLKVGKKHFKELSRECQVLKLQKWDTYAIEEVTSADDKLSILIRGRLKVTCGEALLHFIEPYQFVDSPEWEAFRESSADVFQVTITAEEDCTYVTWPRIRLERVLRHRPMLRQVFESMVGKDITHKLYCLNEHLGGLRHEKEQHDNLLRKKLVNRSLSVDAVHTGRTGQVRSTWFKPEDSVQAHGTSPVHTAQSQVYIPVTARHFPPDYPFKNKVPAGNLPATHTLPRVPASTAASQRPVLPPPTNVAFIPVVLPLLPPGLPTPNIPLKRVKSAKKPNTLRRLLSKEKEVKFETPV